MPVNIRPPNYSPQDQVFQQWLRQMQEQRRLEEERKRQEEAQEGGWAGGLGALGSGAGAVIGGVLAAGTAGMSVPLSMAASGAIGGAIGTAGDIGLDYAMGGGGGATQRIGPRLGQVGQSLGQLGQAYGQEQMFAQRQQAAIQMAQQKQLMQQAQSVNRTWPQVQAEAAQYGTTAPEYLNYLMADKQMAEVIGKYGDLATASPRQRQLIDEYNGFKAGERHVGGPDTIYSKPQQWEYMQNSLGNRRRLVSELSTSPPPKPLTMQGQIEKGAFEVSGDGTYTTYVKPDGTGGSFKRQTPQKEIDVAGLMLKRMADMATPEKAARDAAAIYQSTINMRKWAQHLDKGGSLGYEAWLANQVRPPMGAPVGVPMGAAPAPGPMVTPAPVARQAPPMPAGGAPAPAGPAPGPGQMPQEQATKVVQAYMDNPQSVPPNVFIDAVQSLFPNPKDVPEILKDEIRRIHRQEAARHRRMPR